MEPVNVPTAFVIGKVERPLFSSRIENYNSVVARGEGGGRIDAVYCHESIVCRDQHAEIDRKSQGRRYEAGCRL